MLFEFSNQILAAKLNLEKPKKEFVSSKIVTDSRKISKGDCFLALKGPNVNGHDFIDEALDRGASFIISEKNLHDYLDQHTSRIANHDSRGKQSANCVTSSKL